MSTIAEASKPGALAPLDVQLGDVTVQNLQQFKLLNVACLPVRYSDKFYRELLASTPKDLIKFAFLQGFAVGAVCCRYESMPETEGEKGAGAEPRQRLYIMTLTVLAAYRRRGIARRLLEHILKRAAEDPRVAEVYLHVQITNEEARSFYKSNGFVEGEMIRDYYKRIDPPHCFIFRRSVMHPGLN